MMLRWIYLILALAAALLGLLTVFKAPDWIDWRLAILAGEFGHVAALVPLAVVVLVACSGRHSALSGATLVLGAAALALLLKPAAQAWRLGQTLPTRLGAAFGPEHPSQPPFSPFRLFARGPDPVPAETMAYSGSLLLDFFRAAGRAPAPCVIVVHSGGWDTGERSELPGFDRWLARRGYAVAAIDYRLAPGSLWPAQRDDILAAVAFLRTNAAALGIDPARLVLFGRSAGGQLAEATAYAAHDPGIRGVIALYGPADMNFAYAFGREDDMLKSLHLLRQFLGGTPATARASYDSASGILQVNSASPPTLLMHGELDPLVWHRQSERLDRKLADAGVPHAFVSLPWATHAFEFNVNGPGGQLTTYSVEWFLSSVTR
jgi:acetyl esterase/lipase